MVYDAVQKLVEESQQELRKRKNLLREVLSALESFHSVPNDPDPLEIWQLSELFQNKLLQKMEVCAVLCLSHSFTLHPSLPPSIHPSLSLSS